VRYTVSETTKDHIDVCIATRRIDLLALFIRHAEQLSPEVKGYLASAIKLLLLGEVEFPKRRPMFSDWFVLAEQVRALNSRSKEPNSRGRATAVPSAIATSAAIWRLCRRTWAVALASTSMRTPDHSSRATTERLA
jgi:hypothetical protein